MCHDSVCDGCLDLTNNRDVAPARLINISAFPWEGIIIFKMLIVTTPILILMVGVSGKIMMSTKLDSNGILIDSLHRCNFFRI